MPNYYTAHDALIHLLDFTNDIPTARSNRKAMRAVQSAYRDLVNAGPWSYFLREFRIALSAPDTSTCTYTHTGGTFEREVVRSSGTFPSWAKYGRVIIGGVHYEVDSLADTDTLTLPEDNNPGADVGSGSVTLYRDTYQLPSDFISTDLLFELSSNDGLQYVQTNDFVLARKKIERAGDSKVYAVMGDRDEMGRMQIRFLPYPSTAKNLDGIYFRRPREVVVQAYEEGDVTATAASATIEGSGVDWTSNMVGAVMRIAPTGEEFGTGSLDSDPRSFEQVAMAGQYAYERRIKSVTDSDTLVLDSAIPVNLTSVKYMISDPIELELGVMQTALERMMEYHYSIITKNQYLKAAAELWRPSLEAALLADNRSMAMRRHLGQSAGDQRLGDMPAGTI